MLRLDELCECDEGGRGAPGCRCENQNPTQRWGNKAVKTRLKDVKSTPQRNYLAFNMFYDVLSMSPFEDL